MPYFALESESKNWIIQKSSSPMNATRGSGKKEMRGVSVNVGNPIG